MATVKVTKEMAEDALWGIDWTAVDSMTNEEIARQVAGNPNAAPILSDTELERATFGERVKAIRERLRLTQPAFAERFGFPTASLRDWEQGRRKPDAATTAYLAVIEHEPEAVMRALEKEYKITRSARGMKR